MKVHFHMVGPVVEGSKLIRRAHFESGEREWGKEGEAFLSLGGA